MNIFNNDFGEFIYLKKKRKRTVLNFKENFLNNSLNSIKWPITKTKIGLVTQIKKNSKKTQLH